MKRRALAMAGLILGSVTAAAWAEDWPQFRGPSGSGRSAETQVPASWGADKNIAWKVKVPGYAWSSPIFWGDRVFVTTAVTEKQAKPSAAFAMGGGFGKKGGFPKGGFGKKGGFPRGGFGKGRPDTVYRWEVYCLSAATGKVLWKQTAAAHRPTHSAHVANTFATETPATDGERVYAYFGMAGLVVCYDFAGKLVWQKNLGTYAMEFGHGTGASPALAGGRLFIQCDNEEHSFLVALDAKTGAQLWKVDRPEGSSWCSPLVWKNRVRTEVVCLGRRVRSYDPATGKQLWELGGLSGQIKASPAAGPDLLYVGSGGLGSFGGGFGGPGGGGGRPLFAVKAGAAGDITLKAGEEANDGVAWKLAKAGPSTASPLLVEGCLYVLEDRGGLVSCYDAGTGRQLYKERLPGAGGFMASPWACAGKVFCLDDGGTTHIIRAGAKFELLGQNSLAETCWASPAMAGGALFLRTVDHLYCIKQQ
jgi:outer membrane protein assembly factor BamB